ncbi:MAG: DUF6600 domain-containing protein [Candidatus Acidiferrum sp.]|jgi:hypothetical protein
MMKTTLTGKGRLGLLLCLTGLLCFAAPKARADEPAEPGDPPTRVARVSYIDGSVSIQPGGQGDWGAAAKNRPMTVGDKLWTDKDSRAELQTGVVSIHLGSMTALSFLNLDQTITQMRLAEGSVNFRVKEIREGDVYEVDTPNVVFTIKEAGAFRIDVNENGDNTGITVIRGSGQVTASGKTYDLKPNDRGIFNGTDDVQADVGQAPQGDGLDQWANNRDLGEQNSVSQRYVPNDMPGTEELDNSGTWSQDQNGPIWYPSDVGPDWAPYSNGYWGYVGPWGWTWIGYEPWGFAPYHYGRWGWVGGRWGWYPGPRFGVSIYGPAFVGFLGGGFGFGFGVGLGVGWFPLGWGEPFHPWYHAGFGYGERINVHNTFIRNTSVIHNGGNFNYAYAHNEHAVTAASRGAFTGGQSINRGAAHLTEANLRGAQVTNGAGLSPSRQSSFGAANARANVSRPPSSVENRSVMARTTPGAAASHSAVHTMSTNGLSPGRAGNNLSAYNSSRQNQLSQSRPSTAGGNNSRNWDAQGNSTDKGRAPQGFGSSRPANGANTRSDRPSWAGSGGPVNNGGSRGGSVNSNTPANTGGNRSYQAPQRTNPGTSAPNRTYTAPSRSYGGGGSPKSGGSAPRASGGGGSHGGGGSPHGGGGGGHHR